MDFAFTPEQEALRRDVRAFLAKELTPEVMAEMEEHHEGRPVHRSACRTPHVSALFEKIHARGWVGISYPKEYGGQGGDRISQYIVEEELYRANITVSLGGSGAPAIIAAGTEEQKQHFIPKLISGEYMFAQGFTEPRGGADLASLQCRAVRDGDDYVITGQKIYTSNAESATHIYLMARTNKEVPKHEGISIFLIPMDTPGITIRPLRQMTGESHFSEVFLDGVRIPAANVLGEPGQGWRVAQTTLMSERSSIAGGAAVEPRALAALARRDRKSTRLNSSHLSVSRMPSSA